MKLSHPLSHFFKKEKPFVYVAMGDSTVEGLGASKPERTFPFLVHASLKTFYKKNQFFNLGKAGWKTKDVIDTQLDQAISLHPNLVTISVGANDIFQRVTPKTFEKNLSFVISKLQENPDILIVINTIPDLASARIIPGYVKPYVHLMVTSYNKIIQSLAREEKVIVVDIYSQSKLFAQNYPEFIGEDGLHPSDSGYALWASSIISQLQKYLFPRKIAFNF